MSYTWQRGVGGGDQQRQAQNGVRGPDLGKERWGVPSAHSCRQMDRACTSPQEIETPSRTCPLHPYPSCGVAAQVL